MLSLALSALLCAQPCPCGPACDCSPCVCVQLVSLAPVPPAFQPAAPVWRADPDGTRDLGLWLGDRFLGRWVAAARQYLPYDDGRYGPACVLPPDAPQHRQTAPPPLAYYRPVQYPVFFGSFGGGCANGRCGR